MNAPRERAIATAASRVKLALGICRTTKELYGYSSPVLDETATLRRVALFLNGTARRQLTQDEQDLALSVIRHRFAANER